MKIAIDGPASTGKTTLWEKLKTSLKGYRFLSEAARVIAPSFGVNIDADWTQLTKDVNRLDEFFLLEEQHQLSHERKGSEFVVDSSIFMIAAYRRLFGRPINEVAIRDATYDLILYCPASEISFENDGFRFHMDRRNFEGIYFSLVAEYFRGCVCLLPAEPERLAFALKAIHRCELHNPAKLDESVSHS